MKKIIITYEGVDEDTAMTRVNNVIRGGRVSENKNGKHFCWVTTWTDGVVVYTRAKKKGQDSDSFHIFKR